jgi:hypothetical protein
LGGRAKPVAAVKPLAAAEPVVVGEAEEAVPLAEL